MRRPENAACVTNAQYKKANEQCACAPRPNHAALSPLFRMARARQGFWLHECVELAFHTIRITLQASVGCLSFGLLASSMVLHSLARFSSELNHLFLDKEEEEACADSGDACHPGGPRCPLQGGLTDTGGAQGPAEAVAVIAGGVGSEARRASAAAG